MTKIWKKVQNYSAKILGDESAKRFVAYLKHCWVGKEVLWKVFWLYGVGVSFLLSILFVAPLSATGGRLAESIALLVISPYMLWVLKSTWASADNIETDEFKGIPKAYLILAAKVCTVLGGMNFFLALFA
jgi:hypothetical protein